MDSIGIKPGMIIGELGAGRGYFTFHLAQRVGASGHIYANDIKESVLDDLIKESRQKKLTNITTILGKEKKTNFPDSTMDMIIMMYVFHDLTEPVDIMKDIRHSLKNSARVCIIDRDPDRYGGEYNHFMKKEEVIRTVVEAGYTVTKVLSFLPRDNIYIFQPMK